MLSSKPKHSGSTSQHWSLRLLLSSLVLAALLPGIIGATALFVHQYRDGRSQLEQHTVQTARALVQAIDNKIFRVQALAQGLASVATLAHGDLVSFSQQANATLKQANLGQAVILTDRTGQQVLNTLWKPGVPLPRTVIPEVIQRVFQTGKPVISDVFMSVTVKRPVMTVAVPVVVNGQIEYALTVPMLADVFNNLLNEQHLPPNWIASVLDSSLTIVARTHQSEKFVGTKPRPDFIERLESFNEEVYETTTLDGVSSLVAFVRSRDTLWGIGIAFPLESSQVPLVRHVAILVLGFAVLVALGLGMAWMLGNRIAQSFRAIVGQAAALRAGAPVSRPVVHVKEAEEATLAIGDAAELLRQRQVDLLDSEGRYKALFNNKTMAIAHQRIVTDDQGQPVDYYIEAVNEPYEHLTGLKADEAVGRLATELFPGIREQGFDFIGEFGRLALQGGERNFEVFYPPLGRWLSFYAYSPKLGECTAIFTDVTAQKEAETALETSRQQFAGIVESAMDAIVTVDAGQRIVLFNAAAEAMFQCSAREALGSPIEHLVPARFRPGHAEHVTGFGETGTTSRTMGQLGNIYGQRADGTEFPIEASISQITVNGERLFTVILRDISARLAAEEEIRRMNAELESRVEARTDELQRANHQLQQANRELETYAYAVSHDLRAPLRAINGFTRIFLTQYGDRMDEDGHRLLGQVMDGARRMGDLIDGLLQLSRSARGEFIQRRVDLSALAHRILAESAEQAPNRAVHLEIEKDISAEGDPRMLEALMRNLLDNAWKYTAKTAEARIRFYADRSVSPPRFCVADNGAGFDMAHADQLFQPFRRLHPQGEFAGIGIGLATVQRIVHRHGGQITAKAAPGEGANFCFTLPCGRPEASG